MEKWTCTVWQFTSGIVPCIVNKLSGMAGIKGLLCTFLNTLWFALHIPNMQQIRWSGSRDILLRIKHWVCSTVITTYNKTTLLFMQKNLNSNSKVKNPVSLRWIPPVNFEHTFWVTYSRVGTVHLLSAYLASGKGIVAPCHSLPCPESLHFHYAQELGIAVHHLLNWKVSMSL